MNNIQFNTRQLLALSLLGLAHGVGFLFNLVPLSPAQGSLPQWLLDGYSIGWLVAGIWGVVCATALRMHPHRRTARPLLAVACVVWSSVFFVGWIRLGSESGRFGTIVYLLLAWAIADPPSPWGFPKGEKWWRRIRTKVGR